MPTLLAIAAGGLAFVAYGLSAEPQSGLEAAVTLAVCTAAVTALLAGFERAGIPDYVTANEATWRSFRSGMLVGVFAFVVLGAVAGGLVLLLVPDPDAVALALSVAVAFGFQLALVIAMTYGLGSAAQHWLLRILLWRAGVVPLRFGKFLDYAVSLKLLYRSRGGGVHLCPRPAAGAPCPKPRQRRQRRRTLNKQRRTRPRPDGMKQRNLWAA